jgi:hypothetical protein
MILIIIFNIYSFNKLYNYIILKKIDKELFTI